MVTEEELSVTARFKELMENTSAHGLGSIDRAGKWGIRKMFWSVVFSFALGMFLLQLYWIGTEYIKKDVDISVDLRYSKRLYFPAITFCNLNPIKISALQRSAALKSLLSDESSSAASKGQATSATLGNDDSSLAEDVNGSEDSPVVGETVVDGNLPKDDNSSSSVNADGDNVNSNESEIENAPAAGPVTDAGMAGEPTLPPVIPGKMKRAVEEDKRDPGYGDWSGVNYREKNEKLSLFLQVADTVASVPYDEREDLGHDIWDMLLSCTWKGITCSPDNFTHFFNYKHGNCYTFNSGINGSAEISSKSGPLYGLTLELFLEQSQYIPDVQQAAGMRVSIHDQGTMPFPESNGISIQPGTETSVGVRSVLITREPDPYGDCINPSAGDLSDNIFTKFFDTNYTLESCENNCLYYQILERCDCADTRFRYGTDYPPCLSTNTSQVACQEEVETAYVNEELNCPCANPCTERVFETTISSASWPNDQYKPTVLSQLSTVSDTIQSQIIQDDDFVEKNVLKLHVYFEHLNYESITQSPAYTELDCLSDIGGQIGLWIGFSVITWFEIGEFIIDVFIILCKKMFKFGQRRQTSPMNSDAFNPKDRKMAFEMSRERTVSDIVVS